MNSVLVRQWTLAAIVYIIAYIYSIEIAPSFVNCTTDACLQTNEVHESCLIGCTDATRPLIGYRGGNYVIGGGEEKNKRLKDCLVTFWGLTHFALYLVLGIVSPDLFWETFAIGVGFEAWEKMKFDCHDALDVGLNTAGFLTGKYARRMLWG